MNQITKNVTICNARRSDGQPCRAPAIMGGNVCYHHGGAAPQVIAAAKLRILAGADRVAERLLNIALTRASRRKDSDVIAACRDLLDRAGVRGERDAQDAAAAAIEAKIEVVLVRPEPRQDD